jgi:hypothetical protein
MYNIKCKEYGQKKGLKAGQIYELYVCVPADSISSRNTSSSETNHKVIKVQ